MKQTLPVILLAALVGVATTAARPALAQGQASCGDLLIVLDRSGSMVNCQLNGETKEAIAKRALQAVATEFASTPMGLVVFPDTLANCPSGAGEAPCRKGVTVIDVAADGAAQLAAWLAQMPMSCGGTPTGETMEVVRDYPNWPAGRKHYVLLLTDGQPTCKDGLEGGRPMPGLGGGTCTTPGPQSTCDGGGACECKNPVRVFDAIKALFDKEIHTFVVGFEGGGMGTGCTSGMRREPFNPETLNKMADLGGEPSMTGATRYYSATDAASLNAALKAIVGKIAGGTVGGCARGPVGGGPGGTGGAGGTGGGSGGGGGGGAGGGGSGGQSGQGGGGGGGGGSGGSGPGGVRPRAQPGCSCVLGADTTHGGGPGGVGLGALAGLAIAGALRRRRRGICAR